MRLFTAQEASKLTSVPEPTLTKWIKDEIITPHEGGGPGVPRMFTFNQVLGLQYARMWSVIGGTRLVLKSIVDYFASMSDAKLRSEVAAGRKYLLADPIGRAKLVEIPSDKAVMMWMVNVDWAITHMEGKIEKLQ